MSIQNARVVTGYILTAFANTGTTHFVVKITGDGSTKNLVVAVSHTGSPAQGNLEEFGVDLPATYHVQFDSTKKYKFEVAIANSSGKVTSSSITANSTEVDPPKEKVPWGLVLGIILTALGFSFLMYLLLFGLPGNNKASSTTATPASSTPATPKASAPSAGTPAIGHEADSAADGEIPAGRRSAARRASVNPRNRSALVGGSTSGSHGTPTTTVDETEVEEWPYVDPDSIGNILANGRVYHDTVVYTEIPIEIPSTADRIYRYPIGWVVNVDTDATKVQSAFNLGTERNPRWVLTKEYTGGSVEALRLHNIDTQPLPVLFKLTRIRPPARPDVVTK